MRAKAVSAAETAYIVRRALGSGRSWGKTLEQMCRDDEANYLGLRLEPFARMVRHGYPRPVYLLRDVICFIRRVRELGVCPSNPGEIDAFEVEIDSTIHCPWRARTVTPVLH